MLRIVDVSNWKADFPAESADYDGIVPIVTYGAGGMTINGIINGVWHGGDPMIQAAIARGKKFGFMHYIRGENSAEAEAEFFAANTTGYLHKGVPSFDWEGDDNAAWGDTEYLRRVVRRYIEITGVPPMLYTSQGTSEGLRQVAAEFNCGPWIAQYANNDSTGWQDVPWNEGAYPCAMRQYTSMGYISGYGERLDLNKFYGDESTWDAYAHVDGSAPVPTLEPDPAPAPAPVADDGSTYVVQSGDTLSAIAEKYGTTYQKIASDNAIENPNLIYPGQVLRIAGSNTQAAQEDTNIHEGSIVRPTSNVDYYGTGVTAWNDAYVVTQLNGDRAVLSVNGVVWAAMHVSDLERV